MRCWGARTGPFPDRLSGVERGSRASLAALIIVFVAVIGLMALRRPTSAGASTSMPVLGTVTVPNTSPSTSPETAPHTVPPTTRPVTETTKATPTTTKTTVPPTVPGTIRPAGVLPYPTITYAPTTTVPATTTTLAGIGAHLPVAPATVPLRTKGTNGHVAPVFAWLSAGGLGLALLIVLVRLFLTRSGSKDRSPLQNEPAA